MGQHKFDRQFSSKLKEREIQPKAESWEKLSLQLKKEDRKSRSLYWVSGTAASVAAIFVIFSLVFKEQPAIGEPALVETSSEEKKQENVQIQPEIQQPASQPVTKPENASVAEKNSETSIKVNIRKKQPDSQLAVVEAKDGDQKYAKEIAAVTPELRKEELLVPDLAEVIAEVSSRINDGGEMENSEIDALLYKAAAEISLARSRKQLTGKIDAGSLLRDVEMELEQSFREKVFEVLKDGYLKARTAVANRNY